MKAVRIAVLAALAFACKGEGCGKVELAQPSAPAALPDASPPESAALAVDAGEEEEPLAPSKVPPPAQEFVAQGLELVVVGRNVFLDQAPPEGEPPIVAPIRVLADGVPSANVKVTLNGTELTPVADAPGEFRAALEAFPEGVRPGEALHFVATAGEARAELLLECPSGLEVVEPAEGSSIAPGRKVEEKWTGRPVPRGSEDRSTVQITGFKPPATYEKASPPPPYSKSLLETDTSATLTVPAAKNWPGYLITLKSCGRTVKTSTEYASCCVLKRVRLQKR